MGKSRRADKSEQVSQIKVVNQKGIERTMQARQAHRRIEGVMKEEQGVKRARQATHRIHDVSREIKIKVATFQIENRAMCKFK